MWLQTKFIFLLCYSYNPLCCRFEREYELNHEGTNKSMKFKVVSELLMCKFDGDDNDAADDDVD